MAKRREKPKFPPQGFWLSERGAVVPVQIHAEALMIMPEVFGLEQAPHGKDEVNGAMEKVISSGWIRGRMLSPGNLSFQVWKADRESVGAIYDFLLDNPGGVSGVMVETLDPPGWYQFTFQEFLDKSYPQGWRLGHRAGARPDMD